METERQRRIRERAYEIWVESGHRHGQDEANWARAEREIDATSPGQRKSSDKSTRTASANPKKPAAPASPASAKAKPKTGEDAPSAKGKRAKAEPAASTGLEAATTAKKARKPKS